MNGFSTDSFDSCVNGVTMPFGMIFTILQKMGKTLFAAILFSVFACSASKDQAKQRLNLREKFPASLLQEDFRQTERVIRKNHPALFDFIGKEEYDRLVEQQYEKIVDSLTLADFYKVILPVVNRIGCGHTTTRLPDWVWSDSSISFLPLRLFFKDMRAYVVRNDSNNDKLKAGTEIQSINGLKIPALLQTLGAYVATDGDNSSAKAERLRQSFNEFLAINSNFPKEYEIDVQNRGDSAQKLRIHSISSKRYFADQGKQDALLLTEIDSVRRTAVITIKSFGFYDNPEEFKTFVDRSFEQIRRAKIDHVMLDLRSNSGGDPICGSYLLTYLTEKPVVYFSEVYTPYAALARPMPAATHHFSGKLYTLINGGCFSTTGHLCALLRYHNRATFIGTETGGTYTCNDNSQTFQLVNTGILVRVARNTFKVAADGLPRFKGILPDYTVEPTLQDLLEGRDRVKETAQKLIENH